MCFHGISSEKPKQIPVVKLELKSPVSGRHRRHNNVLTDKDFDMICNGATEKLSLQKTSTRIFAYGSNKPVKIKGQFDAVVETKRRLTTATFYGTKVSKGVSSIIGYQTAVDLHLVKMQINKLSNEPNVKEKPIISQNNLETAKHENPCTETESLLRVDKEAEQYVKHYIHTYIHTYFI